MTRIKTLVVTLGSVAALGFGIGLLAAQEPQLPPCPTEDSVHCIWDASEQGNGTGTDVVNK